MATSKSRADSAKGKRKIRYAVVGLGYIAQVAVLPAFAHAAGNSELAALVSDDPEKLAKLGESGRKKRPTMRQEIERPSVAKPELVNAESPSGEK